jgi:hypothetical protein
MYVYTVHKGAFVLPMLQWKSSKYFVVCVPVALVIQHTMHMRPTVVCGLPRSTVFFHAIS